MSTLPKILVTSAAGKTGLHVALQLLEKGYPVRAFVRRQDERSQRLQEAGAELFLGDQYALSDMRNAMQGIARAYQCAPTAPNGLHFNCVFTVAAAEAQVEHVVTLGQWLSSESHPSLFTREVYLSDQLIRLSGKTTVTSVDPGWFADNYLMVLDMAAHLGLFTMPLGEGDVRKNAPPSNEDIASVVVQALIDPETHAGKFYRPTGPDLMSPNEIASAMGRALGRKVRYVDISERMMSKALRALQPSNYSEQAVSQLAIYADEYRQGSFALNAPSRDVERVGGHAPESFESIVRRAVAGRDDLSASVSRRIGALFRFLKIVFTPALNLDQVQQDRDLVRISTPQFCQTSPDWMKTHNQVDQPSEPVLVA